MLKTRGAIVTVAPKIKKIIKRFDGDTQKIRGDLILDLKLLAELAHDQATKTKKGGRPTKEHAKLGALLVEKGVDDQISITFAKRIVLKSYRIWCEGDLQENGLKCVKLFDSISQEEHRRFVDLGVIDKEGYITKLYPLPKIIIRPRVAC